MDDVSKPATETELQAEIIADAVTNALATAQGSGPTLAQKQATATAIYITWRNAHLGSLPPAAFATVETHAADLISAIAAALA